MLYLIEKTKQELEQKTAQLVALQNAFNFVQKEWEKAFNKKQESEEKAYRNTCDQLKTLECILTKELTDNFQKLADFNKCPNKAKYYDTFYGHKVSDYALENGRLDYATLSKCFDAVLCNNITEVDPTMFENIESGDFQDFYYDGEQISRAQYEKETQDLDNRIDDLSFEDLDDLNDKQKAKHQAKLQELQNERKKYEETEREIFQWFVISGNALELLQEAGELVLYSEVLDCYIWGVDHYGTSWSYVLTSIKLQERE